MLRDLNINEMKMVSGGEDEVIVTAPRVRRSHTEFREHFGGGGAGFTSGFEAAGLTRLGLASGLGSSFDPSVASDPSAPAEDQPASDPAVCHGPSQTTTSAVSGGIAGILCGIGAMAAGAPTSGIGAGAVLVLCSSVGIGVDHMADELSQCS